MGGGEAVEPDAVAEQPGQYSARPGVLTLGTLDDLLTLLRGGLILVTLVSYAAGYTPGAAGSLVAAGVALYGVLLVVCRAFHVLPKVRWLLAMADCALTGVATAASGGIASAAQAAFVPVVFAAGLRLRRGQFASVLVAAALAYAVAVQILRVEPGQAMPWLAVLVFTGLAGAAARGDLVTGATRCRFLWRMQAAVAQLYAARTSTELVQAAAAVCADLLQADRVRLFRMERGLLVEVHSRAWSAGDDQREPGVLLQRAVREQNVQWWVEPATPGAPRGWTRLALPLLSGGAVLGVLEVSWAGWALHPRGAREVSGMQLSTHVAAALANVQAHEQAGQGVQRLGYLGCYKGDFIAMLSHELRTPLTAIKGFAQLLRRSERMDPATVSRYAAVIVMESNHLISTIEDIVHLTDIEEGLLELRRERVEIYSVLERALTGLRRSITAPEFRYAGRPAPVWAVTDAARLEEALRNLFIAAVKYAPELPNSDAAPLERCFDLGVIATADRILIWLVDPAPGLHRSYYLLREFEQAPEGGRTISGSGLSLYIARHIIEALGGSLVIGPYRGGTRYVVRLPQGA
jgi:signal transduction histidine kinase